VPPDRQKRKFTGGSLASVYLAKQYKVGKNRKGKKEHLLLTHRRWEKRDSKWWSSTQVYLCQSWRIWL
jgi:hypothetical protein